MPSILIIFTMYSMYIAVCILMMLSQICSSNKRASSSEVEQQHVDLKKNQFKILERLRTLVSLRSAGIVNASFEVLDRRLDYLEKDTQRRLKKLEKEVQNTIQPVLRHKGSGAIFTRWGRKDCPLRSSHLIYSGSVGSSYYNSYGGGATYLCMPHDPQFLGSLSGSYVYIYGGEYESSNFGDTRLSDGNDIPCAVCQSKRGVQKMMIPAKIKCLEGWTKQYAGYLATSYSKASAEYICMDQNPTAAHGGHRDNEGAMVIPVKAACGALPCPPYKSGDTITCVVCTK